MSYTIHVDGQSFDLSKEAVAELDVLQVGKQDFHVLQDNQSYHCKVIETDYANKTLTLEVNGSKYTLNIEDEYDLLVKKMGLSKFVAHKISSIKAPMPGLIIDILIEPGQTIEKGTPLLILEAMKMENVLKSEGDGVVKSIEVVKAQAVDKGHILIEME
jgi:biotin carboxyl carrier protein